MVSAFRLKVPQVPRLLSRRPSTADKVKFSLGQLDAIQLCFSKISRPSSIRSPKPGRSLLNYNPSHKMLHVMIETLRAVGVYRNLWEEQITVLTSTTRLNRVEAAIQDAAAPNWRIRTLDEYMPLQGGLLIRLGTFDTFCDLPHENRHARRVIMYGTDDIDKKMWSKVMRVTETSRTLGFTSGLDDKLALEKYSNWDVYHHTFLDELQDRTTVLRLTTIDVPGATTRSREKPPRASPALLSPEVCAQIVEAWEKRPLGTDGSTLIFCFDLEQCQALQAAFEARGFNAVVANSASDAIAPSKGEILLACHNHWPYLKPSNRVSSIIMASPSVVVNSEVTFFERLMLTRYRHCHIIQVWDSSCPDLVSIHSLAKLDPNLKIEYETIDSIKDNAKENSSWRIKIYVEGVAAGLPNDIFPHIQRTWYQMGRKKTTIAFCNDMEECLALQRPFYSQAYRTIIADSVEVIDQFPETTSSPYIVLVPREHWSAAWLRRDSMGCDCFIVLHPLTEITSDFSAQVRRLKRECKVIQVVDADEQQSMEPGGSEDEDVRPIPPPPPPQEETTGIRSFGKSDEERWTDNEKKVPQVSVGTSAPEPSALSDSPLQSSEESRPNVGDTVPEPTPTEVIEKPPPDDLHKRNTQLLAMLRASNSLRWMECSDDVFVLDLFNEGHLILTARGDTFRTVTVSCDLHSGPLWAPESGFRRPLIRTPGLPLAQAKPTIMRCVFGKLPRGKNEHTCFNDWHRTACALLQTISIEKALAVNPRMRLTTKSRFLSAEDNADGVEVLSTHEMLEWFAREEGSMMLARLHYSPPSMPLLSGIFMNRIQKRMKKGYSAWGLQRTIREERMEKRQRRKAGKKERKKDKKKKLDAKIAEKAAKAKAQKAKAKAQAQQSSEKLNLQKQQSGSTPLQQD